MDERERGFMERAVELARRSGAEGNPPVGAVVALDGEIVGEGRARTLEPEYDPGRHAEVGALEEVATELWTRAGGMTCYTTLEPCAMCAGTLLLHEVGRVVFGAHDELGGAGGMLDHLPAYYDESDVYEWVGPAMPQVCDPL
ncbi:MAG: nucleoside deaminase, partial [Bradymonadaceae bacterium]